ncbi:ABC transporter permease [Streptomyces sp. XM4193]|uniref:ABC transporter permease n=1 Tax=Streptomyces sp. XM4193 TaxID=2929782 RepID=UPI001FF7039D|nr:ABC transporter permease [Streptomyces sp. XM4193]MCK1794954.1 ABC transporter permease [Streptomyces sp. XM4193]
MSTPTRHRDHSDNRGGGDHHGSGGPDRRGARTSAPPARTLAGTVALLRFGLRRDRLRLTVWLFSLLAGTLMSLAGVADLNPTAEDREAFAEASDSPAGLALSGPSRYLDDYSHGSMIGHQLLGFTVVLVAMMSVFLVVRHTRTEEETGRAELVRATAVGRHAYLSAALLLAVLANLALAALLAAGLAASGHQGVSVQGSLLYGLAHAAVGVVFAAVAAVTVQLSAHSRAASGSALAVLGLAYVLRAAGDTGGDTGGGTLSWLSPIGWAQRTHVYVDDRWWPLALCVLLSLALIAPAYLLSTRRDVGAGLRAARLGSRTASPALLRPLGLELRLHRGMLTGFAVGLLLLGAAYGAILGDVEEVLDSVDSMRRSAEAMGDLTEAFAAMLMTMIATVGSAYVVLAVLRARSEEVSGRAEPLLATGLSRHRWLGGHLTVALLGGPFLLLLAGLGFGLLGSVTADDPSLVPKLVGAALLHSPALWVTAGAAAALFGLAPRWSAAAWVLPVYSFVVGYLGQVLGFPEWMNNLSPFGHVSQAPAEPVEWLPLVLLTVCALVLLAFGVLGFRRRDLESK